MSENKEKEEIIKEGKKLLREGRRVKFIGYIKKLKVEAIYKRVS